MSVSILMSKDNRSRNNPGVDRTTNGSNSKRNQRNAVPYSNNGAQYSQQSDLENINRQLAALEEQNRQRWRRAMESGQYQYQAQSQSQSQYQYQGQQQQSQQQQQPWPTDRSNNNYFEYSPSPRSGYSSSTQGPWSATSAEEPNDAVKDYQRMLLAEQQRRNKEFGKKW